MKIRYKPRPRPLPIYEANFIEIFKMIAYSYISSLLVVGIGCILYVCWLYIYYTYLYKSKYF